VNIASRIATLNRPLGERLLMSEAFVNQLWSPQEAIGDHAVVGVPHPLKLYRPAAAIV
jgi:adenylate cyclase